MTDLCHQAWLLTTFPEVRVSVSILQTNKQTLEETSSLTQADPGMTHARSPAPQCKLDKDMSRPGGGLCQIKMG